MDRDRSPDLSARTFKFACDIYDFCEQLVARPGLARRVGWQLFDAGSSIGANRHEAESAYSRREFAAKNAISLKESREAHYWLRLCAAKRLGNEPDRTKLLREADELVSIFVRIVNRLKN